MLPHNPPLSNYGIETNFYSSKLAETLLAYDNDALILYCALVAKTVEQNYALVFDDSVQLELIKLIGLRKDEITAMLRFMMKHEIFDPYMYKTYGLITSPAIQTIYFRSCKNARRKNVSIYFNHILLPKPLRKEFHLAVDQAHPTIAVMLDPGPYDKVSRDFENSTVMQNHIETHCKALKAYADRLNKRVMKRLENRRKRKAQSLARLRKESDDPDVQIV